MQIFPAIDIKDKKAVRLYKGDFDKMSVYEDDPKNAADRFAEAGASNLHIVDLDGALSGELSNFDTIRRIAQGSGMFTEVGGGIRTQERIERYFECGVDRVILGTAAVNNIDFLTEMVKKYSSRIAVGVDASGGRAAVNGWKDVSDINGEDFVAELVQLGVKTVIYTDIACDGTMQGTNLALYERLSQIKGIDIIASGGISSLDEIVTLNEMGIYGAILGKALYTGAIELSEAIKAALR